MAKQKQKILKTWTLVNPFGEKYKFAKIKRGKESAFIKTLKFLGGGFKPTKNLKAKGRAKGTKKQCSPVPSSYYTSDSGKAKYKMPDGTTVYTTYDKALKIWQSGKHGTGFERK